MILTVTINPCVHHYISYAEESPPRMVVRSVGTDTNAGGKGFNAARVILRLGGEVAALGTAGGLSGEILRACLKREGVAAQIVETSARTRISTCVFEKTGQRFREYLEEGRDATPEEAGELRRSFDQMLPRAELVTLNGSSPGPVLDPLFGELCRRARQARKTVILDTYGNPVRFALGVPPHWIRANRQELGESYGLDYDDDLRVLLKPGVEGIVLSDGRNEIRCVTHSRELRVKPPPVAEINPVGSGDALTGAFALALSRRLPLEEALRWGAAAGALNASRLLVCEFTREDWAALLGQVAVDSACPDQA